MKATHILMLSGLILCGCSQKQATSNPPANDFVQAGKDITCDGGSFILHVTKRDGNSLTGIRCVSNPGTPSESHFAADAGTIELIGAKDGHLVMVTLHNPKDQTTGKPLGGDTMIALRQ